MKIVILCGGHGTRIRDVSEDIPKPMIGVGGYPIIWHIMKYYSCWGHEDFILCLGYKGKNIKDFFMNYESHTCDVTIKLGTPTETIYHNCHKEMNWSVTLAETGLKAMTGARVRQIKKYIGNDETFMLTYGDGLGDVNIDELLKFHKKHGKILTVTGVRPPGRFGELGTDSEGMITEFNEKPQTSAGRISGGFFVCNRDIFNYLEDKEELVFEQEPMRRLVKEGQLMMYEHDGFWQPMDTYREYTLLNELYVKGEAPWVIW